MPQEAFESINDLFFDAFEGLNAADLVKTAYVELLGYPDADDMHNSAARIRCWVERLESDLKAADFAVDFLDEATSGPGNHVDPSSFLGNQKVINDHAQQRQRKRRSRRQRT